MTHTGSQVYGQLNEQVAAADDTVAAAGARLRQAVQQRERLQAEATQALTQLARVRLDELAASRVAEHLDQADQRAIELLQQREQERLRLQRELERSAGQQSELDAQRKRLQQARDAAEAAHRQLLQTTMAALAKDDGYELQLAKTTELAAQAARADAKSDQAEANREQKRRPYEADKLFAYLWRRRYRFPDYRALPLFRTLDEWVAGLCDYERAHRDYGMLLEIPVRLRQHADAVAASAKDATAALALLEQQAQKAAGVPELAAALAASQQQLEAHERQIDSAEDARTALRQQQAALDGGQDPHRSEALATITAQLAREDVATLRRDAAATATSADDALVQTIADLRRQYDDLGAAVAQAERSQQEARRGLDELQDMRRRFRQQGFDGDDSVFDDGFDLGDLVSGVLRGVLQAGTGWSTLRRYQRFRRSPVASTGAEIAGQVLGGILGGVMRSGSRGGFGGFGGGGGGGGFRSGGGFGGGGFRTGGGF